MTNIDFFELIKKFKKEQQKQMQRGLNDYNMVNVVRKENAEVGMHSNIIYSLLDPNGLHYQGDLFLRIFIKEVLGFNDINKFGKIINVFAEEMIDNNRRIDFTIKSTNYCIAIEMKIDADDLKNQIFDYYTYLTDKVCKEKIVLFYYLTKDARDASVYSAKNIEYKRISFEKHILKWIEQCQKEVRNITNLNEALENYKDIVKKITGLYMSKVKNMEELILKDRENFLLSGELSDSFNEVKKQIIKKFFFDDLVCYFKNEFHSIQEYKDFEITINESEFAKSDSFPIRIQKKDADWNIVFQFGFVKANMDDGFYGISAIKENEYLDNFRKQEYSNLKKWKKNSNRSIFWDYTPRRDSYAIDNLVAFKFDTDSVAKEYFELFQNTLKDLKGMHKLNLEELNEKFVDFIEKQKGTNL